MLTDPEGFLILHRTRLDAEGRLALTRLDEALREKWTAKLPILDLGNRYELPDGLLMYGATQLSDKGTTRWEELIVRVDLGDGAVQSWNVTRERREP